MQSCCFFFSNNSVFEDCFDYFTYNDDRFFNNLGCRFLQFFDQYFNDNRFIRSLDLLCGFAYDSVKFSGLFLI